MQLHSDVTSIRGTVGQIETFLLNLAPRLDRIDNRTQLLQASAGAVHTYVLADNRQGGQSIETALQHENLLARAELTSFGDRSRKAIAGNESAVTVNQSTDSRLSGENNADAAMQIRKQLVKSPSFLRDACEEVNLADQPIVGGLVRRRRSMKHRYDCRSVRKHLNYRNGLFNINCDFSAAHTAKCPYYRLRRRSWSCSLSAQLLPILQIAVETTFAATFGAGGNSMEMSLRYFGIIERSKSPAFQLFDSFPDRCARKIYLHRSHHDDREADRLAKGQLEPWDHHSFGSEFYFDWDLALAKAELLRLHRDLSLLLHAGRVSASYSDEFGNTLLHVSFHSIIHMIWSLTSKLKALFVLAGSLGSTFDYLSDQLRSLAELVIDAGVDVHATSRRLAFNYENTFMS